MTKKGTSRRFDNREHCRFDLRLPRKLKIRLEELALMKDTSLNLYIVECLTAYLWSQVRMDQHEITGVHEEEAPQPVTPRLPTYNNRHW